MITPYVADWLRIREDSDEPGAAIVSVDGHGQGLPAHERQAAAQALAGDEYRVISAEVHNDLVHKCDDFGRQVDDLHKQLHDAEAQAAQPDRPEGEGVDPVSVRVGDVVEIEADDGSWMVRGEASDTDADQPYPISVVVPSIGGAVVWPHTTQATVRILRRAEPEPDEAAVEALAEAVRAVRRGRNWGDQSDETLALQLIRDHGVHVEVPSDD